MIKIRRQKTTDIVKYYKMSNEERIVGNITYYYNKETCTQIRTIITESGTKRCDRMMYTIFFYLFDFCKYMFQRFCYNKYRLCSIASEQNEWVRKP